MTAQGAGDRWMAGDRLEGVAFSQNDRVTIVAGPHTGDAGAIMLLLTLSSDPLYIVKLGTTGRDVRVRQSALRRAE